MTNNEKLLHHLTDLSVRAMNGDVTEASFEMKLTIEGVEHSLDFNADTFTALAMMIEEEIKNEE